jgi:hypothetical protein
MLTSIKSLAAVLLFLLPILYFSVRPMSNFVSSVQDYKRRCCLMLFLTIASFLSYDFWIFAILALVSIRWVASRDASPLALYWMILLAVPPVMRMLPGFGIVNNLLPIDYFKILAFVILLPEAIRIHKARTESPDQALAANVGYIIVAYLVFKLLLYFGSVNFTGVLREAVGFGLDIFLPYYVMSRGIKDLARMREVILSFCVAASIAGALAIPETIKHWSFYVNVRSALNVEEWFVNILMRGDAFRAQGSTGQPIILACALSVAMGLWLSVRSEVQGRWTRWFITLAIAGGLVATFSRGPWVGAAVTLAVFALTAPHRGRRIVIWGVVLAILSAVVLASPYGDKALSYLPFVKDNVDTGSADYRRRLIEISMNILSYYPFFGTPYYMSYMEELRQGQGIIDMVNTYLVIALPTGYVGLVIWLMPLLIALFVLMKTVVSAGRTELRLHNIAAGFFSTLLGLMVSIGTASPIGVIPVLLWGMVGAAQSMFRIGKASNMNAVN